MRRNSISVALVAISVVISSIAFLVSVNSAGDGAEKATTLASFSPAVTVFSSSGVRFFDGDIYRGLNYLYAFADEYKNPANAYVKRSVDGVSWSSVTSMSGLNYPHGGFCVYNVGSSDHIIVSALGNVRKSMDDGATFSSLTALGATLDYTGVATNASMDPSRPYDDNIYVAGNIGITGVYLRKSVDNGVTWSSSYMIYNSQSICPILMRDSSKLFCFYASDTVSNRNLYVKNSSDWGKTWGSPTLVFIKTQYMAAPCHAQYIDQARCLLTISDYASPTYSNSRGLFGYFWYSNNTFQQLGIEGGAAYSGRDANSYSGIASEDSMGVNYTSMWCYHVDSSNNIMKTHYSHDSGIDLNSPYAPAPSILNSPSTTAGLGTQYSFNASASLPDNGSSTWNIVKNASWLSMVGSDNTHCLLQGTPASYGSYWANLTVSDSNSSDYVNWTISVSDLTPPTCTITWPPDPCYPSASPLYIEGTASDNVAVTSVTWSSYFCGSGACSGTTSWNATIPWTLYNDVITVTAHDAAGNVGSDTLQIRENYAPYCCITIPAADPYYTTESTVTINGTASDEVGVSSVTWINSRGGSGVATGTTSWSIPSIALSAGSNLITVTATDSMGETGTDAMTVIYDLTAPEVAITIPASDPYNTTTVPFAMSGNSSDDIGVAAVTWKNMLTGGSGTCTGTTSWSQNVPLGSGSNLIYINVTDMAGNKASTSTTIIYCDVTPPTCTIDSLPFSPFYTTWPSIDLHGSATDNVGVINVTWYNAATNASGTAVGLEQWDATIPLILGDNLITITATDGEGNVGNASVTVGYDNIYPTCTVTWPTVSPYYTNASSVLITGTAYDNFFISSVMVETYFYSTAWEEWSWFPYNPYFGCGASGTANWTFNLPLSWATKYEVNFYAYDGTEMFAGEDSVMIIRDTTPPACAISSPAYDYCLTNSSTIDISGSAIDSINTVDPLKMFPDELLHGQVANLTWYNSRTGGSGAASISPSWSISWSLEDIPLALGDNQITVTARDLAGNTGSDILTVTYAYDAYNPNCTITVPTSNPTMTTGWHMINLYGTATDDVKVTSVIWNNSLGGSGTAYMSPQWGGPSVTWQSRGNILLYPGDNVITVTATDYNGNTATDVLTVTYTGT